MHANHYPNEIWSDMGTLVSTASPQSILCIGDFELGFLSDYLNQSKILSKKIECVQQNFEQADSIDALPQSDLVIIANLIEKLEQPIGTQLIARVRDLYSSQLCVSLQLNEQWSLSELFALGLKRVAAYQQDGKKYAIFNYSLNDYKSTPDWLNADNWANPEMWNKYFW